MIRKLVVLISAFAFIFSVSKAQRAICGTDIMHQKFILEHPEMAQKIADDSARLEAYLKAQVSKMDLGKIARTTGIDSTDTADIARINSPDSMLWIPVVVHVTHNYGAENVSDNEIYSMIKTLNTYYQLKNDTSGVIPIFKKFVGKANIGYKLATLDPTGNPTKGITRHYSYATYGADDASKFDLWSPVNYLNIWIEAVIGQGAEPGAYVVAYSQLPPTGASDPFVDGLITNATDINNPSEAYTIAHEVGHYLNLMHPFGSNNVGNITGGCGDDEVDDTPPTCGEFGQGTSLSEFYDTTCASGYVKLYPSSIPGVDSLYDYPDTANVQNIMTYSDFTPELMFTKGQAARMRACLANDIAGRDNLWIEPNLARTGASASVIPDLPVVVDYGVTGGTLAISSSASNTGWKSTVGARYSYSTVYNGLFVCENTAVNFTNESWNDTIVSTSWSFSNGATPSTASTSNINGVKFTQPGWVTVTMTVQGNNTAAQTRVDSQKVFVADPNATNAVGYFQEFNPNGDMAKWPLFNYYNNNFKWQVNNTTGYYDNTSMEYTGFDTRGYPQTLTGPAYINVTGVGDYDDMFTPAFDLTGVKGSDTMVYLSYMYSGASRTGISTSLKDTLEISYTTNCSSSTWTKLPPITKLNLINQGSFATAYQPQTQSQWSLKNIALPAAALTSSTIFRFRYKPGVDQFGNATGNNFFIDRIHFTNEIDNTGINTLSGNGMNVTISPNPTNGDAYVLIADVANTTANIQVTDITGKVVFSTTQKNINTMSRVQIPHEAISVSGLYLVHVSTGSQVHTEKLVVY